jgi:hypothetical protein
MKDFDLATKANLTKSTRIIWRAPRHTFSRKQTSSYQSKKTCTYVFPLGIQFKLQILRKRMRVMADGCLFRRVYSSSADCAETLVNWSGRTACILIGRKARPLSVYWKVNHVLGCLSLDSAATAAVKGNNWSAPLLFHWQPFRSTVT